MSYYYNNDEAMRRRLRATIKEERRMHDYIKALEKLVPKIDKAVLRQAKAKQIVEARDAMAQVRQLLDILHLLTYRSMALTLLRGRHEELMSEVTRLQDLLHLPAPERIHYELRSKPLMPSPYEESENSDNSEYSEYSEYSDNSENSDNSDNSDNSEP